VSRSKTAKTETGAGIYEQGHLQLTS